MMTWLRTALLAFGLLLAGPGMAAGPAPQEILVMLHLPAPHFKPGNYYPGDYREDDGRTARRRVAEKVARQYGLTVLESWPILALKIDCFRMVVPAGGNTDAILDALTRDARVYWAQPVNSFSVQAASVSAQGAHDPLYTVQPAVRHWQLADIRKTATGRNVRVAVIDSGVETDHPDLAGQIVVKENFVDGSPYVAEDHGTGVAAVIAALPGNGVGIEGVAPGARIMALRACWQAAGGATRCNSFTLAKALNYALTHGAQVINLSLAGPPDRLLSELIDAACARGMRVISAVDDHGAAGGFPASHPGVFAVSARQAGAGSAVLSAPGRDIPTAAPGARWNMVSGSSYSAAHISGMMAVLSELRPSMPLRQLRTALVADSRQGAGATDLCATLTRLTGKCTCVCNLPESSDHAARH